MARGTFWESDSPVVLVLKAVINALGAIIGKNFGPEKLHAGDLGLEMRIHRGKLDNMTEEQRHAAARLAKEMFNRLMAALGVSAKPEEGFEPGLVVQVTPVVGIPFLASILFLDKAFVIFECIRDSDGAGYRRQLPRAEIEIEEVPEARGESGLLGLIRYLIDEAEERRQVQPWMVDYISDQHELAEIVQSERRVINNAVGRYALARITDQEIIDELAGLEGDEALWFLYPAKLILARTRNVAVLLKAINPPPEIRVHERLEHWIGTARQRLAEIGEFEQLKRLAMDRSYPGYFRGEMIKAIGPGHQNVLLEILLDALDHDKGAPDRYVRDTVLENITDRTTLERLLQEERYIDHFGAIQARLQLL